MVRLSRPAKTFTPKQGQYLAFIHLYMRLHRRPPAETDMQQYFRVSPPSVHQMVLTLDSRAKCNRALREPDLHVFAKLFENCLKRSLEAKAFSGREIGGDDDVLDFLVGHFVDVDLTRQPAS